MSRAGLYRRLDNRVVGKEAGQSFFDRRLLEAIRPIKEAHPFWGYRRIWAWLKFREGFVVGRKRVYRLLRENDLLVPRKSYRAKRDPDRKKPRATRPRQYWGIDMTKFIVQGLGWVYLVVVLDWCSKKVVGWDLSLRSRSAEWLRALDGAVVSEFADGVRGKGLKLISDNGSQPSSRAFMNAAATLGIEQVFTSYNNPKGNAETERFMRTLKEEVVWLNEFESFTGAEEKLRAWFADYNQNYPHSSLGYMSPEEFELLFGEREKITASSEVREVA